MTEAIDKIRAEHIAAPAQDKITPAADKSAAVATTVPARAVSQSPYRIDVC